MTQLKNYQLRGYQIFIYVFGKKFMNNVTYCANVCYQDETVMVELSGYDSLYVLEHDVKRITENPNVKLY